MLGKTLSVIAALFFFVCAAAAQQEPTGIWAGAFEADDVFAAIRVNFDESKIVLSFAGSERPGAFKNLRAENGEFSFDAELQPRARFSGKVAGAKIEGTFDIIRGDGTKSGSGVWYARKVDSWDFAENKPPASSAEKPVLPNPVGTFPVGRRFFYWTDESRAETITAEPNDKRKIFVQLWYPARAGGERAAEYYPNLEELRAGDKSLAALRAVKTHARQDAKIAASKTKFPVVVFSPGLGSSPFSYTAIIENLVSRGYAVAAINHAYDSGDFKFSGGEAIRFASEKWDREVSKDWTAQQRKQFFDERRFGWARDISFDADRLEKLESPFKNRLDLQNLGLLGHSFGGQAATVACAADARFKACANLDGMAQGSVVLPDAAGKVLKQPFLFFSKAAEVTDAELRMMNLSRAQYRERERRRLLERWKPSFKARLAQLESGAYFALYPGIKHSSFSDSLPLLTAPDDPLFAERIFATAAINEYITAFFDKFLKKQPAPLFDNPGAGRGQVVLLEFLKQKGQK